MVLIKDGIVCKKCNFDIYKLYNYLYSRDFRYLVDIINYERDNVSFKYEEDYSIDSKQKGLDLVKLVGLLHSKTSYNKDVDSNVYKDIYELINDNLLYLDSYYSSMFDRFVEVIDLSPCMYMYLCNYYVIDSSIKYCKNVLDNYMNEVKDKNKQRVSIVHNNLNLDHYIKNSKEYLISFDNYIIDSPIIDLYKFFRYEWKRVNINDLYNEYSSINKLNKDEELLLFIILCMPYKIEFSNNERNNIVSLRDLIDYLVKVFELIKE